MMEKKPDESIYKALSKLDGFLYIVKMIYVDIKELE